MSRDSRQESHPKTDKCHAISRPRCRACARVPELKRIEGALTPFCGRRSPAHARHQVRTEYRVKGHDVLIVEVRVVWDDPTRWTELGVAKLKFIRKTGEWTLFWRRASLRWQAYEPLAGSRDLAVLVGEVDRDPHRCFFG